MIKTERIVFMASPDEAALVDKLAAFYSRNRSQMIRESLREAATRAGLLPARIPVHEVQREQSSN